MGLRVNSRFLSFSVELTTFEEAPNGARKKEDMKITAHRVAEIEEHERKRRKREREVKQNKLALERLRNQMAHRRAVAPAPKVHNRSTVWTLGYVGKTDTIPNWAGKIRW